MGRVSIKIPFNNICYLAHITYYTPLAISPLSPRQQPTTSPVATGMVVGWYIRYMSAIHRVTKKMAKQHQENVTRTFTLSVLVFLASR